MLKVAIIGIGNAGSQVAEYGKRERNIPGVAINSSNKDLINITAIDRILIGDEKGAGKDRNEAKKFMKTHIQDLCKQEKFRNLIESNEVIFVASSIGGGTGSGMSPVLTEILSKMYPSKKFVLIEIYPAISESAAAQQNGIDYLQEVRKFLPHITYMAYDNNRRVNRPTDKMMLEVNAEIVEDICVLRGDYQYPTPFSSIDEKDALRLIETPGRLCIAKAYNIKEKDLDDKSIEDILIGNLKNVTVAAELDRDRIVKRLGLITNLNNNIHELMDTKLNIFKAFTGEPVEGFEHIYINKAPDESNKVIVILSGLSIPDDRITKMVERIQEAEAEISKVKESSVLDSISTDNISKIRHSSTSCNEGSNINIDDTFDKYFK